jgi:hypothetical protein
MVFGIDFANKGWTNAPGGTTESAIPAGLSAGDFTAVYTDNRDNGYYSGVRTGTVRQLREAIANPANWTTSDSLLDTNSWVGSFEILPEPPGGTVLLFR